MRLTTTTLLAIANHVAALERSGVLAHEIVVHGHRVSLERTDDQRDGVTYYVTGIGSAANKEAS